MPPRSSTDLNGRGVIADFRAPDIIRVAPIPLYTSFHDAWRFAASWRSARWLGSARELDRRVAAEARGAPGTGCRRAARAARSSSVSSDQAQVM